MTCSNCGIQFVGRTKSQVYCSDGCRVERYKILARFANGRKTRKICKICKKQYINKCNSSKYCSDKCKLRANANRQKEYRESRKGTDGNGNVSTVR